MAKKKAAKKPAVKRALKVIPTTCKMGRYEEVVFEFYNDATSVEQRGTVVIRADAMVLDIPEQDGIAATLIIGKPHASYFRGCNSVRDRDAIVVDARWADMGEVFAGIWQDENDDLLFRFYLPRKVKE